MIKFLIFLLISVIGFISAEVYAQNLQIKRLTSEVAFDGSPYEEAWNDLYIFPLVMNRPNYGSEPSEKSEVMIAYDDQYLWVGARLFMTDATRIASKSKKRDETGRGSDSFGIIIDTYNDNENAFAFFTMPSGLRMDYTVFNDAVVNLSSFRPSGGGGAPGGGGGFGAGIPGGNISWNTFWDVKTTRDENGWYVEMRIPFSSLRFKPENDIATMGLIINRSIVSNNEIDTHPAIDPKYGMTATNKPSLAANIEIAGADPSRPVYLSPYVSGGYLRSWELTPENSSYLRNDDDDYNAGLDVKYNISSNLTLDLTVNTDFAQVESDNQQVNLTRYSLFFPEKRMFFQERSSLFSFNLGGTSDLFYSRNIGIADGEQICILGGARMAGRIGNWDVGLIDMQTDKHIETPGENFGVFRLRRNVINENSYVGGIFTSRLGMDGSTNFAYGLDGIFRVFGVDYLDVKFAQTFDNDTANDITANDPVFISSKWERRSDEGVGYDLGFSYSGREFNPGIGFVRQGSMWNVNGSLKYGWLPGPESRFFSFGPRVGFSRYTRIEDGGLESFSVQPSLELNTKKGARLELGFQYSEEGVLFPYPLAEGVFMQPGMYKFFSGNIMAMTPMSKPFSTTLMLGAGEYYDGWNTSISVMPIYNVSSSLQLTGTYLFNHIEFPDRSQKVDIHSASVRATVMLSTKLSASVFVQYVSTTDELVSNFRLRFNPREGNDFYFVFNGNRRFDKTGHIPKLPDYDNRVIMLKYTHTFIL